MTLTVAIGARSRPYNNLNDLRQTHPLTLIS
jgi:hypothetical protein